MKKAIAFFALAAALFQGGCGIIGVMGTPSPDEEKSPAEYNLAGQKDKRILVLVEQPAWLSTEVNMRYYLTKAIRERIVMRMEIPPEQLIAYDELAEFRSAQSDFSQLSPVQIGAALKADMVLLVEIENCDLNEMADTGYYKGSLSARATLFDTAASEKLWPKSAKGKGVSVGFEVDSRGKDIASVRLATAAANCIVRYLYDCPKAEFKTADEAKNIGWGN